MANDVDKNSQFLNIIPTISDLHTFGNFPDAIWRLFLSLVISKFAKLKTDHPESTQDELVEMIIEENVASISPKANHKVYPRIQCPVILPSLCKLQLHKQRQHDELAKRKMEHICGLCQQSFSSSNLLELHLTTGKHDILSSKENSQSIPCNLCNQKKLDF